jgi:hypothetical protein
MEQMQVIEEVCTKQRITQDTRTEAQRRYIERLKQQTLIEVYERKHRPPMHEREKWKFENIMSRIPNHLRPIIEEDYPKELRECY